jgi:hypothetical protein
VRWRCGDVVDWALEMNKLLALLAIVAGTIISIFVTMNLVQLGFSLAGRCA